MPAGGQRGRTVSVLTAGTICQPVDVMQHTGLWWQYAQCGCHNVGVHDVVCTAWLSQHVNQSISVFVCLCCSLRV